MLLVSTSDLLLASFQIPSYTPKRVVELTASQRERAAAVRAEIRTVIAQSLQLITCSLHLDLSSFIRQTACPEESC